VKGTRARARNGGGEGLARGILDVRRHCRRPLRAAPAGEEVVAAGSRRGWRGGAEARLRRQRAAAASIWVGRDGGWQRASGEMGR
jgi:hypothetical protein